MRGTLWLALALILLACENPIDPIPEVDQIFNGPPVGWSSGRPFGYELGLTSTAHEAKSAAYLRGFDRNAQGFSVISQSIRAEGYRGKRVRWKAWIKHDNVDAATAGLFMRVDAENGVPSFDNMSERSLSGSADWHEESIVLDVPNDAIGIQFGVLLHGRGLVIIDEGTFEVVTDVPVTVASMVPNDPTYGNRVRGFYIGLPSTPVNLQFESITVNFAETVDWLKAHASSLTTTDPNASLADLAPITSMIGDASVVGLGEGTHGTREFATLKHRLIRHLVTEKGFNHVAFEVTSLEADDLDRYVQGAPGDPAKLISRLYFWNVRAQETLDLVEWLRAYNATVGADLRVHVAGVDIQYVAAPMDSVTAFIGRVDPAQSSYVATRFECMVPFRNNVAVITTPRSVYGAKPAAEKTACANGLAEVRTLIANQRSAYSAAEPARYEGALHAARLVQQFEKMAATTNVISGNAARDSAMAENVSWIKDQGGAAAKVIVWAHNDHVSGADNATGEVLRSTYGTSYRSVGFLFGEGGFRAVGGPTNDISNWSVAGLPGGVLERYFVGTTLPLVLFDARQLADAPIEARVLAGPIQGRSIGSFFDPAQQNTLFWRSLQLPRDFDLLIFIGNTTPTLGLPYTP